MSKINNMLVAFVAIFVATAATAQTNAVKGVVTDTADAPIYNSNVVLMQNGNIVCGSITKADGSFKLEVSKGRYGMVVSCVGYKSWTADVTVNADTALGKIVLFDGVDIDEVEVRVRKKAALPIAGGLVYTVSQRDVQGSTNSYHLLSKIPDLQVDRHNHSVSVVGASSTLIMVNGVRRESIVIQSIRPSEIAKVEVITNPSAKYLSEDITSVVNIITHEKVRGFSGEISQMVTVPKIKTDGWTDLTLAGNTDKASLYAVGFFNYGHENRIKRHEIVHSFVGDNKFTFESQSDTCAEKEFPNFEVNAGADYKLSPLASIVFDAYYNYYASNSSRTTHRRMLLNDTAYMRSDRIDYDEKIKERQQKYAAYFQRMHADSSGQLDLELSFADYLYSDNATNDISSTNGSNIHNALNLMSSQRALHCQIEYGHDVLGGYLAAGYRFRYQRVAQDVVDFDGVDSENAVYSEFKHYPYLNYSGSIGRQFTYKLGLGSEYTSFKFTPLGQSSTANRYTKLLPTTSVQYAFKNVGTLSAHYGVWLQRVEIQQLNPAIVSLDSISFRQGNPNLEPYLYHRSGLRYTLNHGDFYFYSQLLYNWAKNSIVSMVDVQPNGISKFTYVPAAFYSVFSPSIYTKWTINDMLELSGSVGYRIYSYTDKTNKIDARLGSFFWDAGLSCYIGDFIIEASLLHTGKYLRGDYVGVSPFDSRVQVDWQFAKGWNVGVELRYLTPWEISGSTNRVDYQSYSSIARGDRYLRPSFIISYTFERGNSREQTNKRIKSSIENEKLSL